MFTFQTMNTKRRRDEDSDSDDGFYDQHQAKKWRAWTSGQPHLQPQYTGAAPRPSPTQPRFISDLEALTPAHSDESDCSRSPATSGGPVQASQMSYEDDDDMDMDEDNQDVTSQPPDSPYTTSFMRPAMLNASLFRADPVNQNGRLPTPIHPTFKRSAMNGLGFPTSGAAGGLQASPTSNGGLSVPMMQAPTSRKNSRQDTEQDRSRRMPSPISEDEDIPDTPTALTQSQLSRLSFSQNYATDQMDMESTPMTLAMPPTPRGRKRSGAFTGMGRFTMGYRDDCEKCKQRVPGHYSHFLP